MKTIKQLGKKLRIARQLTYIGFIAFPISLVVGAIYRDVHWVLIVLTLLPLSLFIPTMRNESYKGLSLLCFVLLMYFVTTVLHLFASNSWAFDWVELAAECLLFNAAMMFSRWKQYSLYQDVE